MAFKVFLKGELTVSIPNLGYEGTPAEYCKGLAVFDKVAVRVLKYWNKFPASIVSAFKSHWDTTFPKMAI